MSSIKVNCGNIEISNDNYGKPSIKLKGSTATFLRKKLKKNKKMMLQIKLEELRNLSPTF